MDKSHKRHIAKAVTWRIIGTLDTILLSWMISGNYITGLQVGFAELFSKTLLYYLHERVWFNVKAAVKINRNSKTRHLAKTITWRIVGTLDTIVLVWIISGSSQMGLKVGGVEVVTKMILYYLHERVWYRSNFGLEQRHKQKKGARRV